MNNEFRNWSDVRVFLAVVRCGSTLAASRQLAMAQPTVARRIDALEHATGLTLFNRDTRGFSLTGPGHDLVDVAEAMEAAAAAFQEKTQALATARPIRITAFATNFSPRMIDIINRYSAENPGVAFDFLPSVATLDLMAGEADIALRLAREPQDPKLISRKISEAQWTLFGGSVYAKTYGLPKSTEDFEGHRFVAFKRGDVQNVFHDWLAKRVRPEQIVSTYTEMELMVAAIRSGQGLGIVNNKLVEDDADLIPCFAAIAELAVPHLMLVSPDAYRRAEVKSFVRYFAPRYAAIFKSPKGEDT